MNNDKRIFLASPRMMENEEKYVKDAFESNWIAPLGPFVNKFEDLFKDYTKMNAVALSSGTAALHLAVKLAGVKEGDIVFCSSLTFSASCNPVLYEKAVPIFIDSEEGSFNMSPVALEKAFLKYPNPKAVIIVSLYGTPASMEPLMKICKEHNVTVIEDAAESLGATYKGKLIGTFGKYNIISFNGNKIITTSGGGMLLTDNEEDRNKAFKWATQSREAVRWYEHKEIGYNYRMSNICAAIGCGQFEHLNELIDKKVEIFNCYNEGFKDIKEIVMLNEPADRKSTHWLSVMRLVNTKVTPLMIIEELEKNNIEARHIWKPMHLQPIFEKNDFFSSKDKGSICEDLFLNGVCLPSDTNMSKEEQDRVIEIIKNIFN